MLQQERWGFVQKFRAEKLAAAEGSRAQDVLKDLDSDAESDQSEAGGDGDGAAADDDDDDW